MFLGKNPREGGGFFRSFLARQKWNPPLWLFRSFRPLKLFPLFSENLNTTLLIRKFTIYCTYFFLHVTYLSHPENRIEIQKNINELKKKRNIFRKFKTFIFTHLKNCNTFQSLKTVTFALMFQKKPIFQFQKAATFADQFKKYDNFLREKQDEHCGLKKILFSF